MIKITPSWNLLVNEYFERLPPLKQFTITQEADGYRVYLFCSESVRTHFESIMPKECAFYTIQFTDPVRPSLSQYYNTKIGFQHSDSLVRIQLMQPIDEFFAYRIIARVANNTSDITWFCLIGFDKSKVEVIKKTMRRSLVIRGISISDWCDSDATL